MPRAAILTASDGVSRGEREDTSGVALAEQLEGASIEVTAREVVPDDRTIIATTLRRLADDDRVDLVVVTGGTGFAPRDVTPEATTDVVDRQAPGLAEAMRAVGRTSTPMADLSRATAGIRGRTLIVNVPGSPRGATESLAAVLPLLPHALQLLSGDTQRHPPDHGQVPRQDAEPHGQAHAHQDDQACALAHGVGAADRDWRLVAVNATPVALYLLHWGRELGYRTILVEPDGSRVTADHRHHADAIVESVARARPDATTDVVATDHDVPDLDEHLAAALRSDARWIGLMGSKRHAPPHVEPLKARGFGEDTIARVQRPIGLDIGSKTPPEIALATLAGLLADRSGRLPT